MKSNDSFKEVRQAIFNCREAILNDYFIEIQALSIMTKPLLEEILNDPNISREFKDNIYLPIQDIYEYRYSYADKIVLDFIFLRLINSTTKDNLQDSLRNFSEFMRNADSYGDYDSLYDNYKKNFDSISSLSLKYLFMNHFLRDLEDL